MQITKRSVITLYEGDELFGLRKSFIDALARCNEPQVNEQIEAWKSEAEEKNDRSAKREQLPGKKKAAKGGDEDDSGQVLKKKAVNRGTRSKRPDDADEDENFEEELESSKKGRQKKDQSVKLVVGRKTRKAERDAVAEEYAMKEAQLIQRLQVREDVFVDENEIAVSGITNEGQRDNALVVFLRRYRGYHQKEASNFDGKIPTFVESIMAECDDVYPFYKNKNSVSVSKIVDRKVVFMDASKISGDETFRLEGGGSFLCDSLLCGCRTLSFFFDFFL